MITTRTYILITLVISVFASLALAQNYNHLNIDEGNLFKNSIGRPLIEFWEDASPDYSIAKNFTALHINANDELILNTYCNNKAVITPQGRIVSLVADMPTKGLVEDNGYIYTLGPKNNDYLLFKMNRNLRVLETIVIKGVKPDLHVEGYTFGANGSLYILAAEWYDDEVGYTDKQVYYFDKTGTLLNNFPYPEEVESIKKVVSDNRGNLLILRYDENRVVKISPQGKLLKAFDLPFSEYEYSLGMSATRENTLLFTALYSNRILEMSMDGKHLKNHNLNFPELDFTRNYNVVRTSQGNYIVSYGQYSHAKISKFDSDGAFLEHIYPFPEKSTPKFENQFIRIGGSRDICQGPEDSLLAISNKQDWEIINFSQDGEILSSFKPESLMARKILLSKKDEILLLYDDKLDFYNLKGVLQKSILSTEEMPFDDVKDFVIDIKGNIYILRNQFTEFSHFVIVLSPDGEFLKNIIAANSNALFPPGPVDMAMNKENQLVILFSDDTVRTYSRMGKLKRKEFVYSHPETIDVGESGNIYFTSTITEGLEIRDSDYKRIGMLRSDSLNGAWVSNAFEAKNGRLYSASHDATIVLNNLNRLIAIDNVGKISGKLKLDNNSPSYLSIFYGNIILAGVTPKGVPFSAKYSLSFNNKFSFPGVPIGSKVSLWTDLGKEDLVKFKKPLMNFTVTKPNHKRNFIYSMIPEERRLIRGRVLRSSGAPIPGAKISNGNEITVSRSDGTFAISATPRARNTLKIEKEGLSFKTPRRNIRVKDRDVMFIDFIAK